MSKIEVTEHAAMTRIGVTVDLSTPSDLKGALVTAHADGSSSDAPLDRQGLIAALQCLAEMLGDGRGGTPLSDAIATLAKAASS